jgi:hypothetical protein
MRLYVLYAFGFTTACVHDAHPVVVEKPPSSDSQVHASLAAALGCGVGQISTETEPERSRFLSSPSVVAPVRAAIEAGTVIEGMCPLQAFAAAGRPGPYMVRRDPDLWDDSVPPPVVITAQCDRPDASVIHLVFRNSRQFPDSDASAFRVKFEHGRATQIQPLVPDCSE